MSTDVTPGQVSAEDRERIAPLPATPRLDATPGSQRCGDCHGPILRFPSGLLRCVDEGKEVDAATTYLQPDG